MNRILSVLLSLIMIFGMPAISADADESLSVMIDNPSPGSVVENKAIEVELSTTGDVSETVLEFDGAKISGTMLTESMLTLGKHTLVAYVIGEDGSVESADSEFKVVKSISNSKLSCDFSDINTSDENLNGSTVQLGTGVTCIPQISKPSKGIVNIIEGPDGEGDTAVSLTSASSFSSSRPFYRYLIPNGSVSTCMVLDFDIKVNSGTNVLLSYVDTANVTGYIATNTGYLFDKSGKILNTSYTLPLNKWYNIKLVIDVTKDVADLFVSHFDEDLGYDVTEQILDDSPIDPTGPISDIRINYHGNANCGFAIDNVSITEEANFTGIGNLGYIYDGDESSDIYPDSSKLTAIKVYMNETVSAKDFSDIVEITGKNGTKTELSSVEYIAGDNALLLTPKTSLNANSEYKVTLHLSAVYSGELADTDKAAISFKTAADSYGFTGADFKVGTTKLITSAQLKNKKLAYSIHFANSETEEQTLSIVVAVRSGNELVGLDIKNVTVPGETSDHIVSSETNVIPETAENVKIQVMLLESMTNRQPVFSTYETAY